MKKIFVLVTATVLALAGHSFAAQPDGTFQFKGTKSQGSETSIGASQITQNGQFVSGNCDCGIDQTTAPQSRADLVRQNDN
jgi:hypothetical protein